MPRGLPLSYIRRWGISKLAWRKFREGALTKGVPTRTAAIMRRLKGEKMSNPRKRRRYFPSFRARRRRSGMTIPIVPVIGLGMGILAKDFYGQDVIEQAKLGDIHAVLGILANNYLGYHWRDGSWDIMRAKALPPLIISLLIHKFVGGAPLNFNRMLGRAKIPFIRI